MQITRSSIQTQKGPADWFTGDVYIDAVAAPEATSTFAAALVHFTPGARTAWHTHPHGQTIFVTEGAGLRQREGGRVETSLSVASSAAAGLLGRQRLGAPGTEVRPQEAGHARVQRVRPALPLDSDGTSPSSSAPKRW